MPFFYSSGEEIRKGDRVLLHEEPGEIELVADPASAEDWLVKKQGGGIMVLELKVFGRLFISEPQTDEHLTFVSRQTKPLLGCAYKVDFPTISLPPHLRPRIRHYGLTLWPTDFTRVTSGAEKERRWLPLGSPLFGVRPPSRSRFREADQRLPRINGMPRRARYVPAS